MDQTDVLTVRELTRESDFDFDVVTGDVGIDKAITGIHLSDLRDPAPWMIKGSVLLTTGPAFAADPNEGLRLLDGLAHIDASAVGVAIGHHLAHVYPEMIERARTLKLPVFEIPYGVPLRTIVAYVYHALASSDMHRLRRIVAVENRLLDSFIEEKDAAGLIESVAAVLQMPVALFDANGRPLACSPAADGAATTERLWRVYAGLPGAVGPLGIVEAGQERYYYREVVALGKVERVIAAGSSQTPASEFAEMSLSFLQRARDPAPHATPRAARPSGDRRRSGRVPRDRRAGRRAGSRPQEPVACRRRQGDRRQRRRSAPPRRPQAARSRGPADRHDRPLLQPAARAVSRHAQGDVRGRYLVVSRPVRAGRAGTAHRAARRPR
jgi:hypothetical protein